jgi:aminoglycoside phosphotransferase (APT) family kinase protein
MRVSLPAVRPPTLEQLAVALSTVGLPPPARVSTLGRSWVHANYRLEYAGTRPDVMLRRQVVWPGHDSLGNELAALTLLVSQPAVPVVGAYRILPRGALPYAAAVSAILPGRDGGTLLADNPQHGARVAQVLGEVVGRLQSVEGVRFGTRGERGIFVPRRATWRADWELEVHARLGAARSGATGLGRLGARLWSRLKARLPALDEVDRFCLLHRDLSPPNLLFQDQGGTLGLAGVVDWEGAMLGDPMAEWANLLAQPTEALAGVVRGFGEDAVRGWLEQPSILARLEVYALTRCLARCGFASGSLLDGDRGRRRAELLERAVSVGEGLAEQGSVHRILSVALGTRGGLWAGWRPDPIHVALRRALAAFCRAPGIRSEDAEPMLDALAACFLAMRCQGNARDVWVARAHHRLDGLGASGPVMHGEPTPDREAWRLQLVEASRVGAGARCLAFTLTAAVALALDALHGTVDDAVLGGVSSTVHALLAHERAGVGPQGDARTRLVHALRGRAAACALAEDAAAWSEEVEAAWPGVPLPPRADRKQPLQHLVEAAAAGPMRPLRPSLLWALASHPGDAPTVAPSALLPRALG